jgi:hypothetical protein
MPLNSLTQQNIDLDRDIIPDDIGFYNHLEEFLNAIEVMDVISSITLKSFIQPDNFINHS